MWRLKSVHVWMGQILDAPGDHPRLRKLTVAVLRLVESEPALAGAHPGCAPRPPSRLVDSDHPCRELTCDPSRPFSILTEDHRAESEMGGVGLLDGLVYGLDPCHTSYGPEGLLGRDRHRVGDAREDGRGDEIVVVSRSASQDLGALRDCRL